jgi:hypothetical protein
MLAGTMTAMRPSHPTSRRTGDAVPTLSAGLVCLAIAALAPRALAQTPQGAASVVVVAAAAGEEAEARERRFIDEVRLAFDEIEIRVTPAPGKGFATQALGEQILWVRSILERDGSLAALWINGVSREIVLLHIVVLKTERIVIRMVQIDAREGFETDLAMSARESLGEAFLLSKRPDVSPPPLAAIVDEVRARAAAPTADAAAQVQPAPSPWHVWSGPVAEIAIAGGKGPPLLLGGAVGLDRRVARGFGLRLGFGALSRPLGAGDRGVEIRGLALVPTLAALYFEEIGRVSLGPVVDVQAVYANAAVGADGLRPTVSETWRFRAGVNVEVRVRLGRHAELSAAAGLVVAPTNDEYRGAVTGAVLYATPRLAGRASLGVVLRP